MWHYALSQTQTHTLHEQTVRISRTDGAPGKAIMCLVWFMRIVHLPFQIASAQEGQGGCLADYITLYCLFRAITTVHKN